MLQAFKTYFQQHPLRTALFLGLFFRMLAVIFAKGFGWHDDHFLIIEASQSWVDGFDYNNWLPSATDPTRIPQGHSFFYVGIHYLLLKAMTVCGFTDPQGKMYVLRFLHAMWSLLIIILGFKITYKRSNLKVASYVGLMFAVLWFMPFMSVRNLVEYVCIPPLMFATWYLVKNDFKLNAKYALLTGLMLGIGFSIRFQTLFFTAGFGIALLILRTPFKYLLLIALSFAAMVLLSQGLVDYCIWGRPFAEFTEYVNYNLANATTYGTNVWHMYFGVLLGMLLPPLSLLIFAGFFKNWKKEPLLFWPSFIFFAFHTYFPNKQERFILPVLPFIVILGTIGLYQMVTQYHWDTKKWFRGIVWFCLVLNMIALPVLTFSYSKRNRVEAMCYIRAQKDASMVMIEDSNRDDFLMPPLYYLGKWGSVIGVTKQYPPDSALYAYYHKVEIKDRPNYVVFMQAENIDARVDSLRKRFPTLTYMTTVEPSFIDKTLHWLNPLNDNQTSYIYKIK
ncbi:MAG: hypothetical protein JST26_19420 [Bacteroidetes bacterium]|nr:hypothetical protein [Bacteroidota bacterium]